jgi:hypothetical protein
MAGADDARERAAPRRTLIRAESLWAVLRAASALRSLIVDGVSASDAAHRWLVETQLSKRLRSLRLGSGFLSSRQVHALVANRSIEGLSTLDLRENSLLQSDVERLRCAPHFARTAIVVDAPR